MRKLASKIRIEISLGNDAMRLYAHVRAALRRAIEQMDSSARPSTIDGHKIMDANGNSVGTWEALADEPTAANDAPMALDDRETATVLHALRAVQCEGRIEGCNAGDCDHFDEADQLTNDEIDQLCERLNFHDVAAKAPEPSPLMPAEVQRFLQHLRTDSVQHHDMAAKLLSKYGAEIDYRSVFAGMLKQRFPWLGTQDEANGAEAIDALVDLYSDLGGK